MPVVLSRIRLAAVARGCRMVTSESDEVLAKHRLEKCLHAVYIGPADRR
jgi:hypothetical protein